MSHLGNLISALIDGELEGMELDRANAHLAGCAACQTEASALRQLKRELRTLGDLDGADAMTGRLLAMIGSGPPGARGEPGAPVQARALERKPGRRVRRRRGRYVIWSAMSLVVVGVGAAAFGMGGASSGGNEPQITPQLEVFDVQHALTSGDVPFADPADARTRTPARTTLAAPAIPVNNDAALLRAAVGAKRP
jgi:anti-sigma factor RsiW